MSAQSEPQVHLNCNRRFLAAMAACRQHEPMVKPPSKLRHDGDRLRVLMERADVSQSELAEKCGVSLTAVGSKWLNQGKIARDRIPMICAILGCTSDELLGLTSMQSASAVAEERASYDAMRPDVKALVETYLSISEAGQTALRQMGDALSKPTPLKKTKRA